jgi:hypothetical protein
MVERKINPYKAVEARGRLQHPDPELKTIKLKTTN